MSTYLIVNNKDWPSPPGLKRNKCSASLLNLSRSATTRPDRYLEECKARLRRPKDVLNELEDLFAQIGLEDEDLLDRAERRDLPEKFQLTRAREREREARRKEPTALGHNNNRGPTYANVGDLRRSANYDTGHTLQATSMNHLELCTANASQTRGLPGRHGHGAAIIQRAPPLRRSAIPDVVYDDLAVRKLTQASSGNNGGSSSAPGRPGGTHSPPLAGAGLKQRQAFNHHPVPSYLLCSSVYTPTLSAESLLQPEMGEPNIEKDDLSYRKLTQADAANVLPPHPPFGIPLGPVVGTSVASDYLNKDVDKRKKLNYPKPSYQAHIVRDDMAFRTLRKDLRDADRKSPLLLPVTTKNVLALNHSPAGKEPFRATRSLSSINLQTNTSNWLKSSGKYSSVAKEQRQTI
ncbi:hypothetical protein HDE_06451 [Halotydeus destructor]|nr:hypothetical protein HDE_06451 [Halotydeus destructor]